MKVLKYIAVNGLIFLIFGSLALAVFEVYLRYTIPESSKDSIFEWTLDNNRYKVMKKNARVTAWGQELRTNDLGFRDDKDEVAKKADDGFRVIVLGDSFTVSGGVEFGKIYTSLLNDRLAAKNPNAEVVNLAVAGYYPVQYKTVLEEVGLGLQPDMVLVGLFPSNDFDRGRKEIQDLNYRRAAFGQDMPQGPSGFRSLYVYLAYLWRIETKLKALFANPEKSTTKKDESGWRDNLEAIRLMSGIANDNGIEFLVVILPHNWDFIGHRKVVQRVQTYCQKYQIRCLNSLETFIASGSSESSFRLNVLDSHPNAKYHVLIADFLTPYLMEIVPTEKKDPQSGD